MEFDIPEDMHFTRVYIEGLGPVAEEIFELSTERGCFFYPFVEAEKEYTIRIVFLRDEDRDPNDRDISFGHRDDDGVLGWFETKVTAGENSKGEVRFTSKGKISVDKRGNFRFTERPTFQNEDLLYEKWEVDIGLVEGISWEHDGRRTKWHATQIPSTKLTETTNLYTDQENEGTEYSIDFICVRPIMHYTHGGKTYKYQWDSFVEDIFYPPIEPDLINGIYLEFDKSEIPLKKEYSRCDVTIDGIGKVSEMIYDSGTDKACFFYPFVEPGKKYTVRFSFKNHEPVDSEGFTLPTQNDTLTEVTKTVTVGAKSKGEVRLNGNKWIHVNTNYDIDAFASPVFKNEELLAENGNDWEMEMGLVEGISWEYGEKRRTKWHCSIHIPKNDLYNYNSVPLNLRKFSDLHDPEGRTCKNHEHDIDFICVRPIMFYKYEGKEYKYMWDGYVQDIYPPMNPNEKDGIYFEFEKSEIPSKDKYSRCDVTIDGIGRVSEMIYVDEITNKGYFSYPFVEPCKEYTVIFSFKKPELQDSEGFTLPTKGSDTLSEFQKKVTAGTRSKGEVRLTWENGGYLKADSNYNIIHFAKPEFENEYLLTGNGYDWMMEIGLMEGVSWDHGDERRTKWHCAVTLPKDFDAKYGNTNLHDLKEMSPGNEPCQHDHDIDCLCVRPIMWYTQDGKAYKYQWGGYTSDVHYPLNADFQEIDINNPQDVAKIQGTWTQNEEWDDTEHYPVRVHVVWNETLVIDDTTVKENSSWKYTKLNGSAFTKQEIIDGWCYYELSDEMLNPDSYFFYEVGDFQYEYEYGFPPDMEIPHYKYKFWILHYGSSLSSDYKTLTEKDEYEKSIFEYFKDWDDINDKGYTRHYELKLFQDGRELQVLTYGTDEDGYYDWTDVYKKQ